MIMPKAGITVESCIIGEWVKKVGDTVKIGDILFTYETDKASFECESTAEGTLLDIFFEEGDEVPCLENVCAVGPHGEPTDCLKPGAEPAVVEEVAAPAAQVAGKAILFSRVTCPNCRVAETQLGKAGVAYEKLIADENLELCKKYGVKGAPTLVITDGENHVNYYSVPEIKKYLASL